MSISQSPRIWIDTAGGAIFPGSPERGDRLYVRVPEGMSPKAVELILEERARQVEVEGWTPEHDDGHDSGEIACAASCYATPDNCRIMVASEDDSPLEVPNLWPWHETWWKPTPDDRIRELVKAGALIAAEIERLQRQAP